MDLKEIIRDIPNFPTEGILFRDITTVLQNGEYFWETVEMMKAQAEDLSFDVIVGPESRGFIFGTPFAYSLKKGFVPVRKSGRLPFSTISKSYDLEYGSATIEIHTDAIKKGDRVLVVDDLLATGGTCKAIAELVEEAGGTVAAFLCLIELEALNGRGILKGYEVRSLVKY